MHIDFCPFCEEHFDPILEGHVCPDTGRCQCSIRHFRTAEGGYWYEEYTCPTHTKDPLAQVERALMEQRSQLGLPLE